MPSPLAATLAQPTAAITTCEILHCLLCMPNLGATAAASLLLPATEHWMPSPLAAAFACTAAATTPSALAAGRGACACLAGRQQTEPLFAATGAQQPTGAHLSSDYPADW